MFEYAAFGFVTLVWWTWPCLWAVVLVAVYGSQRLSAWRDRRIEQSRGLDVRPCMVHLGTTPDGREQWCWQQRGHDGPHLTQWGVPQEDFELEHEEAWEDEELRLEKMCGHGYVRQGVNVHCALPIEHDGLHDSEPGTVLGRLCGWGEDGADNESACWKMEGHDGPHMVLDNEQRD